MGTHRRENGRELRHYFASQRIMLADGLQEVPFGEFLVERRAVDRYQLFRALQLQDRHPGIRIGECVAALGYLPFAEIERLLAAWRGLDTLEVP